jgi:transcriptional antiterminator RfaH
MFPGYGFVEEAGGVIDRVRCSRYVTGILLFGGVPARVPARVVEELVGVVGSTGVLPYRAPDGFHEDQVVVVEGGPFAGLAGKFQSMSGARRCRVMLRWLGREVTAVVDVAQLRKAAWP